MSNDDVSRRLWRLRKNHLWADEFFMFLESAQSYLCRDHLPEWARGCDPMNWDQWNAVGLVVNICRDWRKDPNDPWPREFAAVQNTPVECCGEIEADAHWLTWVLTQEIWKRVYRAVVPGRKDTPPYASPITDEEWQRASWAAVNSAIHLGGMMDAATIATLRALTAQEYERARQVVKSERAAMVSGDKTPTYDSEVYLLKSEVERIFGMGRKAVKHFCDANNIPTIQEARRFRIALVPFAVAYARSTSHAASDADKKRISQAMQQNEIASRLDAATAQFFGVE